MSVQKLSREQAALIGAYTGVCCGPFSDIHALAEKVYERPIWTHEFADSSFNKDFKEKIKPLFIEICAEQEE